MKSPVIGCLLVAAAISTSIADPIASAKVTVKDRLGDHIEQLRTSAKALEAAGLRSQARRLAAAADDIAGWAGSHESLTTGQIDKLESLHKRLGSAAKMWAGAGQQGKADILRRQAAVVSKAIAAMKPLAKAAPAGAGGAGALTVLLRPGAPPAGQPAAPQQPQRPAGYGPGPGMGMGGPAAGMGMGGAGIIPTGPAYGGSAPRPRGRAAAAPAAAAAEGLTIVLREPKKTFGDVVKLRTYLDRSKSKYGNASVTFRIDGKVRWSDVQRVVNTFHAALSGPMQIADLKLRGAPAAAIAATPPGPLPAELVTRATAAVPRPTAPAQPAPPAAEAKNVDVLGSGLDPVFDANRKILFALDVPAASFDSTLSSLTARLTAMPSSKSVAVWSVDSQARPVKVVDWTGAGTAAAFKVGKALRMAGPAGGRPNFTALTQATQFEWANCEVIIYVVDASRLPGQAVDLDAIYKLSTIPMSVGISVVGPIRGEMRGLVQQVGNRSGNAAIFVDR